MDETFVEFIGTVVDATTLKMMACINLGADLGQWTLKTLLIWLIVVSTDLKLANDVVELIHGPQPEITKMFF